MSHTKRSSEGFRSWRWWLAFSAVGFTWLVFGSRYLYLLLYLSYQALPRLERLLTGIYVAVYPVDLLFTYLGFYVASSVLALVLTIAALIWVRAGRLGRTALMVSLFAVVALPIVFRYQPAVWVDPEYTVRIPTQPGPLSGVVKAMQVGAEVRRCEYELLGWSQSEGALYGEEICGRRRRVWAYWPLSDHYYYLQEVSSVPDGLLREQVMTLEGVHSVVPPDDSLRITVRGPILKSPEGWWYAFVARHIYGPEDVLVVSSSPRVP